MSAANLLLIDTPWGLPWGEGKEGSSKAMLLDFSQICDEAHWHHASG